MNSELKTKCLVDMQLRKTLKHLLTEKDLSVAQISRATGVSSRTIHNWLTGQTPGDVEQVKTVADHLKVSLDYLLFGVDKRRDIISEFQDEINAGIFEVILRRVKK